MARGRARAAYVDTAILHGSNASRMNAEGRMPGVPGRAGLWRHAQWLPDVSDAGQVSLGEGDTPLVALPRWGHAHGLRRVYAKLEFANPTGSFKDRGMAVLVSLARQAGAEH